MSSTQDDTVDAQSKNDDSSDIHTVWVKFKDRLDDIEDNPAAEGNLAGEFAETLAKAYHNGDADIVVIDRLLGQFARNADVKKSKLERTYESYVDNFASVEEEKDDENDSGPVVIPPDKLLQNHVEKVIKYVPTDASADARYIWVFDTGDTAETKYQHLATNHFSDEVYNQVGIIVDDSTSDDCELAWRKYVRIFIENHKEERTETGDRTLAVEDLRAEIERRSATSVKDDAAMSSLPWVNEEEDEDILHVPSDLVQRVLVDYDTITARDLQVELDARDVKKGNVKQTSAAGTLVRFWPLNIDFADVSINGGEDDE